MISLMSHISLFFFFLVLDVETCVNGLMGIVSWVLDYGRHFVFGFMIFLLDSYGSLHCGFDNILMC